MCLPTFVIWAQSKSFNCSQSTNQICLHFLSDKSENRSNIILIRESGLLITEALNYLIIVAFKIRYSYLSMDFPLPNGYIYRLVKNEENKECIFQIKEISDKNQALVSHFIKFKQKIILQEFLGLRCLIFGHNFLIRTWGEKNRAYHNSRRNDIF